MSEPRPIPVLPMPLTYDVAGRKILGKVRKKNEDFYRVERLDRRTLDGPSAGPILVAVADGMGRHGGGDVASRVAVQRALSTLRRGLTPLTVALTSDNAAAASPELADAVADALAASIYAAHERVLARATTDPALSNMGTTITLAVLTTHGVYWANVGDSRLLWLRADGEMRRVSRDHSVAQVLVDLGQLDEAQASTHPMAANLTSFLGPGMSSEELRISPAPGEASWFRPAPGDVIALSTDGVTGAIQPVTLARLLGGGGPAERRVRRVLHAVMKTEASDNATLAVAVVCGETND